MVWGSVVISLSVVRGTAPAAEKFSCIHGYCGRPILQWHLKLVSLVPDPSMPHGFINILLIQISKDGLFQDPLVGDVI